MTNTLRSALLVAMLCTCHLLTADNIITFFIRPYHTSNELTQEEFNNILQEPGKLARKMLINLVEVGHFQGVLASYMGYITPSDYSGQITFPRMHPALTIKLLITPMVEPIMMLGVTVHHLALLPTLPAQMYTITRKQDQETGIFYWDTQEAELPETNRIPLDTIILFAKPNTIIVPTGITITDDSPMLILPDMYATKELNVPVNALRVLKIRNFFGPIQFNYTKQTDVEYAKQLKQ